MSVFRGDVVLVVGGDSITCQAELMARTEDLGHLGVDGPGLTEWLGILSGFDSAQWATVANAAPDDTLLLRLPDGREGEILISAKRDRILTFEVQGTGDVPF